MKLDLLAFATRLRVKTIAGRQAYFDPTRRANIAITPEEMVRQALMLWLHEVHQIPYMLMRSEYPVRIGRLQHRIDLLVLNRSAKPILIIETKAPSVPLSQKTAMQASIYNSAIFAPLLMIANGSEALLYEIDFENKYTRPLADFPELDLD